MELLEENEIAQTYPATKAHTMGKGQKSAWKERQETASSGLKAKHTSSPDASFRLFENVPLLRKGNAGVELDEPEFWIVRALILFQFIVKRLDLRQSREKTQDGTFRVFPIGLKGKMVWMRRE